MKNKGKLVSQSIFVDNFHTCSSIIPEGQRTISVQTGSDSIGFC